MACFIKCGSTIIGASNGLLDGSEDVMSLYVGHDADGHPQIYSRFPARAPWQNFLLAHGPRRRRNIPVEDATSSSFQRRSNGGNGNSAAKSRPSNPVTVAAAHESQNGKYSSSTGLREITLT